MSIGERHKHTEHSEVEGKALAPEGCFPMSDWVGLRCDICVRQSWEADILSRGPHMLHIMYSSPSGFRETQPELL